MRFFLETLNSRILFEKIFTAIIYASSMVSVLDKSHLSLDYYPSGRNLLFRSKMDVNDVFKHL